MAVALNAEHLSRGIGFLAEYRSAPWDVPLSDADVQPRTTGYVPSDSPCHGHRSLVRSLVGFTPFHSARINLID